MIGGAVRDPAYQARREGEFLVAVNCTRAGGTCFCASMGTGPRATTGFDIVLTEIVRDGAPLLLAEAGSDGGRRLLAALLRMVHDLGIVSIAEGIETPQAAEICRDLGFQLLQGYYFGVPAKSSEWFRRRPKANAAENSSEEASEALPAEAEPPA